jgi:hypothetical protein
MPVGQIPPSSYRVCVAWTTRVVAATLYLAVHGCTAVDGGAVEVSWKLRPASGSTTDFIDCDSGYAGTGPVTEIRLDWQVGDVKGDRTWACIDGHGVTRFELPAGQALLSVVPVCATGPAAQDTYVAPAPEQRTVIVGDTVSLGAIELVLQVSDCTRQPCICQ